MTNTKKRATRDITDHNRTKIIATVGPAIHSYEAILNILESGASGFRLNFGHGNDEQRKQQIGWIRKASKEYKKPVAIIQDLQGPKVRLGDFDDELFVHKGQELRLQHGADYEHNSIIPIQFDISKKVNIGDPLNISDGKIHCEVTSVKDGVVGIRVLNDGVIKRRDGVNLPDTDLSGQVLTRKDREDLRSGNEMDIDFVALSYVQSAKDIEAVRRILNEMGSSTRIIAKIETKQALNNIKEIILACDAVMVARGDLAHETHPEEVPVATRNIIGLAQEHKKTSIIATQMLATMTSSPEPTRAEASDVATATILGADCVMLSDETAIGEYPIEAVSFMKRIITYTQQHLSFKPLFPHEQDESVQAAISSATTKLAHQIKAKAIVAQTKSGATARSISIRRPSRPIVMVTTTQKVANQLAIVYGGKVYVRSPNQAKGVKLVTWLLNVDILGSGDRVVISSGMRPNVSGGTDTIKVRVL